MSISTAIRDIKSLKVQGAERISKTGLSALREMVHSTNSDSKLRLLRRLAQAKTGLEQARPTEPCLRNALDYVFRHSTGEDASAVRESFLKNIQKVLGELGHAEECLCEMGAAKISNGMILFTHCHSSAVIGILKRAKQQGKRFEVHNTETRPHFQGRRTAAELASSGIKVVHYIDAAARFALKKADMMLIGCDAFTSEGKIINKIGSELFAETAYRMQIPVYVCTTTWKFDPATSFGFEEIIERRSKREVWENPPRNVQIDNHAFEIISPNVVTGMITELGVYRPEVLVEELRNRRSWLTD
jgi:ribose 1,5-bisphosphate isomerase